MTRQRLFECLLLLIGLHGFQAQSAEVPHYGELQHLGVATCASGVCHGSVQGRTATPINQNEYVIWSRRDRHRVAYNTLLTDESKRIAKNLGLKNAHEADMCLDCHADNVPAEMRGEKFRIEDGVGCEACHGGAEYYISSHVDQDVPREEDLEMGLYPADDPRARAKLCLSCHLGTSTKMASHDIMGAGHPRIAFELDTFGILQPAHYVVDDDYGRVKWSGSSVELWAVGQIEAARQTLGLIEDRLQKGGVFPELALFDCHACHHAMSDQRWQASGRDGVKPGSVPLNDANFVMLFSIAGAVAPELELEARNQLRNLHKAVTNRGDVDGAIAGMQSLLNRIDSALSSSDLKALSSALIAQVVTLGKSGQVIDYVVAEQAIMALDMLLNVTGAADTKATWLNEAYEVLSDEDNFQPYVFTQVMKKFKG